MFFCVMVILGINNHIVKGTGVHYCPLKIANRSLK